MECHTHGSSIRLVHVPFQFQIHQQIYLVRSVNNNGVHVIPENSSHLTDVNERHMKDIEEFIILQTRYFWITRISEPGAIVRDIKHGQAHYMPILDRLSACIAKEDCAESGAHGPQDSLRRHYLYEGQGILRTDSLCSL